MVTCIYFSPNQLLRRFGLVVAMSVSCLFVCLSPSYAIYLRGLVRSVPRLWRFSELDATPPHQSVLHQVCQNLKKKSLFVLPLFRPK